MLLVPERGLEPLRISTLDFESSMAADYITLAYTTQFVTKSFHLILFDLFCVVMAVSLGLEPKSNTLTMYYFTIKL